MLDNSKIKLIKDDFPKFLLDKEIVNIVLDTYIDILKTIEDELAFKINYAELEAYSEDIYYITKIFQKMGSLREDLNVNKIETNFLRYMDEFEKFNINLFKRNRSTPVGIKFLYNLMKKTGLFGEYNALNSPLSVKYSDELYNARDVEINVDMDKVLYWKTIGYSTHPLGYSAKIAQIIYYHFVDQVLLKKTYTNSRVEINCSQEDGTITTVFNPLEEPYNYIIKNNYIVSNGFSTEVTIIFTNDHRLVKQFNGDIIHYDQDGEIIQTYPGISCAMFFDIGIVTTQSTIKDSELTWHTKITETDNVNKKMCYYGNMSFFGDQCQFTNGNTYFADDSNFDIQFICTTKFGASGIDFGVERSIFC